MLFLILGIILAIAISTAVFEKGRKRRKSNGPGFWIEDIIALITIFRHNHVGKLFTSLGNAYGPIAHIGFGPLQLVIINGVDEVKRACRHPSLNGRSHCLYKNIIGEKGIIWTDDSSQKRKFIFRNTRHFEIGGKSGESNIHEEISLLFQYFDSFEGNYFSVKQVFNVPTLNGVGHRMLGEKIPHDHPKLKHTIERMTVAVELPNFVKRMVCFMPILAKWLPGDISGDKEFKEIVTDGLRIFNTITTKHSKSRIASQPRDFVDALMDEVDATTDLNSDFHASRDPINPILFDMLSAAVETTGSSLEWIVLYLSHYPEIQEKLQVEVSQLIGTERLSQISDRAGMPYVQAFIQEVFRIAPPTPFGFHMAVEKAEFRGHVIEKGTCVIANFYGVHMDPKLWEQPEKFMPERFIDPDGQFLKTDNLLTFGFGKRSCVGEMTARDQIFLYTTRILQTYRIVLEKKLPSLEGRILGNYHSPEFQIKFLKR